MMEIETDICMHYIYRFMHTHVHISYMLGIVFSDVAPLVLHRNMISSLIERNVAIVRDQHTMDMKDCHQF